MIIDKNNIERFKRLNVADHNRMIQFQPEQPKTNNNLIIGAICVLVAALGYWICKEDYEK